MNEEIKEILLNAKRQIENRKNVILESENSANFDAVVRPQLLEADEKFNAAVEELRRQTEQKKDEIKTGETRRIHSKVENEFAVVLSSLDKQINELVIV